MGTSKQKKRQFFLSGAGKSRQDKTSPPLFPFLPSSCNTKIQIRGILVSLLLLVKKIVHFPVIIEILEEVKNCN
jgi:hypothetical protein